MKLNKKVIEGITVLGLTGLLTITAVTTNQIPSTRDVSEAANTGLEDEAVAGVTAALYGYQRNAAEENLVRVSVESKEIDVVAAAFESAAAETASVEYNTEDMADAEAAAVTEAAKQDAEDAEPAEQNTEDMAESELSGEQKPEESETAEKNEDTEDTEDTEKNTEENTQQKLTKEEKEWQKYLMADVDKSLNVRAKGKQEADVVGKLYKGDRAKIVKKGKEWTKIKSGNVTGYVKNSFCVFGADALAYAKKNCATVAEVKTDGLRIRKEQSKDGAVVTTVASGEKLVVDTKADTKKGWVAVTYDSKTCYVSADYVEVSLKTGKALTLEEEAAKIAAEEAAKRAAAEAAAKKAAEEAAIKTAAAEAVARDEGSTSQSTGTTQGASVSSSTDDVTLLAALIYCEAGGTSYESQLAVGAVVVNRMKSGSFPNTLRGVIYQRGQFGPVSSGKLASRLTKSVTASCRRAAQNALSGVDNTGGAKYFKLARSGHSGRVIGPIVFY